jgi:hypothetical protein
MITNKGQSLLTKYLVGQTPAYASYIAVGCGATPQDELYSPSANEISLQKLKNSLDFEMFRIPITSRGYVTEISEIATITGVSIVGDVVTYTANNSFVVGDTVTISGILPSQLNIKEAIISSATSTNFSIINPTSGSYSSGGIAKTYYTNIVFTGELPTEERYEVSEIGLFSAQSNPDAGSKDSKILYSFSQLENWQFHGASIETIPVIYTALDAGNSTNSIDGEYFVDGTLKDCKVFHTNSSNSLFGNVNRANRYETPRFLNNFIAIRGNLSALDYSDGRVVYDSGDHIHLNDTVLGLDRNSPSDELKLAFSVINTRGSEDEHPSAVRLLIEFSSSDTLLDGQSSTFEVNLDSSDFDFSENRYFVISKKISELNPTSNFLWLNAYNVKIYASVLDDDDLPSDNFYVCLDALRLENVSNANPLYGMFGYSPVKSVSAQTIKKLENTTNYIEFRFGVDV